MEEQVLTRKRIKRASAQFILYNLHTLHGFYITLLISLHSGKQPKISEKNTEKSKSNKNNNKKTNKEKKLQPF